MKACNQLCPWNTLYGCKKPENEPCILSNIPCESFEQKPYTNADHIRAMTDEELVGFVYACDLGFCRGATSIASARVTMGATSVFRVGSNGRTRRTNERVYC